MNSKPEKFLLFTLEYPPFKGGISQYYQNLVEYWPSNNLFVLADSALGGKDTEKIIYRPLLNKFIRPRWLAAVFYLYKKISSFKSPVSNLNIIVGQILPLGIATYCLSKFLKFKYSVVLHGLDFSLAVKTKSKQKITRKILNRADKIICANNYTANLVKFFNNNLAAKIFIVNPGIEPSFVRNPQKVAELKKKHNLINKTVLFSLGRLVLRKGIDKVIEAVAIIDKIAPQIVYAIAGTGPEKENLKKLAEALPEALKNKILFLGQISDSDRWAWFELCDIFVMASRNIAGDFEGFGTVYLEANLAGKPVIAGDSGGVRDAVIDNINGLIVNPEKSESIARAIIKLSADVKLRQALGDQGKRRAVENFSAKKQAGKFYNGLKN